MIKNSNKFIKATKIILIICSVFVIQKVNMVNLNDKITNENLNKTIDLTAMAYKLTDACLSCGSCADACPVEAIKEGDSTYVIDADSCISCGSCADTCPVQAIVED